LVAAASIATLAGAWGFQLIGGLAPCPMCLEQRWAYYAAIPVCLLILFLRRGSRDSGLSRLALGLCGLAIFAGGVYGAYHAGVEWKWWPGPNTCSAGADFSNDPDGLPDLTKPPVVPCDEAAWRLFGISLAGYNVLISLALTMLCGWALGRRTAETPLA
jgi:disulfide bond formation protein DsbB